jgi:hypothetical protein
MKTPREVMQARDNSLPEQTTLMRTPPLSRRAAIQKLALTAPALACANSFAAEKPAGTQAIAPGSSRTPGALPTGTIGKLQISRLILGCNLITGSLHSRDLRYVALLSRHYNSEAKILETFAVAEAQGIQTFMTHARPEVVAFVKKHHTQNGGKLQCIVSPVSRPEDRAAYSEEVQRLAGDGINAMYVFGQHTDQAAKAGKIELVRASVEAIKTAGVPAGVAAHSLEAIMACEKEKIGADFYVKTFHHHNYESAPAPGKAVESWSERIPAYWCRDPEGTSAFMATVDKPWIAFKVMAAGAIPPKDAFRYALSNGADFILAGMFDFQIAEDVQIMNSYLARGLARQRPWRG